MFDLQSFAEAPYATSPSLLRVELFGTASVFTLFQPGGATIRASAFVTVNSDNRIFAASDDYISRPTDQIASRLFAGTVRQALRFNRSILGSDAFGSYTVGLGEMILTNAGQEYDHLVNTHALDGRDVVIRLGDADSPHDSFGTIFSGQSTGYQVNGAEFIVDLRDNGYLLEVPASPNTFAGTGGIEGGDDLKGRRKPRPFGFVENVMPAALTPNSTQVFAVGDRPVKAIPKVYVRGAPLTLGSDHPTYEALVASTVAGGAYNTCLARGLFRPAFVVDADVGQVTADVEGETTDGVLASTTADIVALLARGVGGGTALDLNSLARVNAAQPAAVGYYVAPGDEATVAVVMSRLMNGIGGWVGFRRNGLLEVGILTAPIGVSSAPRYTDIEIISIDRERLPDAIEPPPYRLRAIYGRNGTLQDDNLAGGSVTEERRAFVREPYRISEPAEDLQVRVNHPQAQDPAPIESYFREEAPAKAEALRRLRLYRSARSIYRMSLKIAPFGLDLGSEIHATYPRWDLKDGKALRVVSIDEDTENNIVEVVAYG